MTGEGAGSGARANALRLIDRLRAVIEEENATIRRDPGADVSGFVEAKNRGLYELELAFTAGAARMDDAEIRARAGTLKAALDDNERLLDAHIGAVGEALNLVERASGAATGDGTYANPRRPKGYL
ncbi:MULTISPECIES: hypothetical protein [unclassified Roseitalea]|uniref:hypothetical protein n=1 Tax=unclassified Roseitalea TaxID=2639107 RepID=UPI00273E6178|nr:MULTISPECIES: hypothetical protein [unclassified Roseitalea]